MESITPFLRSPVLPLSGPILMAFFLAFFWMRAGSIYALLERIWRLGAGKAEVADKYLSQFIKEIRDLEKFQFMFGIKVDTKDELHKVLEWLNKNAIGMSNAQTAKRWIDVKSEGIISQPPRHYISIRAGGMAIAAILMMVFIEVTFSQFALLQMKGSKTWFLTDAKIIKGFNTDWVIERNQCEGNPDEIIKISGFYKDETKMVCEAWKDRSLEQVVIDTVKTQKRMGDIFAIGMIISICVMFFQMRAAEAALKINNALTSKTLQSDISGGRPL